MKIFVNKPLKYSKNLPEIIKSIKETENNHKKLFFDLGRNPLEIVHGPFMHVDPKSKNKPKPLIYPNSKDVKNSILEISDDY